MLYFLETGRGDQYGNPSEKLIRKLINQLQNEMGDDGAIWMIDSDENAIQLYKDLVVMFDFVKPDVNKTTKVDSFDQGLELFLRFRNGEVTELKQEWLAKK